MTLSDPETLEIIIPNDTELSVLTVVNYQESLEVIILITINLKILLSCFEFYLACMYRII